MQGSEVERQIAVAVYGGTLTVTAVFFTLLWLYAASGYRLLYRNLDPRLLRAMTRRYVLGMLLYVFAFALAFVSVLASLALIIGLALIFVLPEPGERRHPDNPSGGNGEAASPEAQPAERPHEG
ncbi:MAG: hypothetical protein LC751_11200, partial [Actinobacteria bacterium]|nr:hypothetical protein [Actinomycetota bacterium]